MRDRQWTPRTSLAVLILSLAAAFAQSPQPRKQPDVPYVPTSPEGVQAMLKLAGVKPSDVVYDLGCGDGRIVVAAAKNFGAHAVGVDIDPRRIQEARANAKSAGVESLVRFEQNDLFQADIHTASVVTLFLLPEVNVRLRPRLLHDLRPGSRIVSNTFDMGDWKPVKEFEVTGNKESEYFSRRLYLWVVPGHSGH